MDFQVIFMDSFLEDLERILRTIANENPCAAGQLGNTIVARAEQLSFFPERHTQVRSRPGLRRFIVARYFKVFYRIQYGPKIVEVLRCWDGRQQLDPV